MSYYMLYEFGLGIMIWIQNRLDYCVRLFYRQRKLEFGNVFFIFSCLNIWLDRN